MLLGVIPLEIFSLVEWHQGELADVPRFTVLKTQICFTHPQCDNSSSASQTIPCTLWNSKVHYRIQNSPRPPRHVLQILLILSSHLYLGLPSGVSPKSPTQNQLYTLPVSHTCNMPCPSHSCFYTPIVWAYKTNVEIAKKIIYPLLT